MGEVEQEIKDAKKQAVELEKKAKKLGESLELIKAGGMTVEKVEQLLNDPDWRAHCDGRTCVVAFLPHILDDFAKGLLRRKRSLWIFMRFLESAPGLNPNKSKRPLIQWTLTGNEKDFRFSLKDLIRL